MKNFRSLVSAFLAVSFACISNVCPAQTSEAVLMGASQVNITPTVPIPMSGYDARKEPFKGVHDQLFASALYFGSKEKAVLLISADLIGYRKKFVEETGNKISELTGVPPRNIMMTAVHNHGAPISKAYEDDVPDAVNEYMKELQQKLINISVQAYKNAVPFRMGTGTGFCDMNINRRAEFADGSIWLGRAPGKPCDHDVEVIRFEDLNKNILAVLINWPCHGTASGQENYEITGDWPGAAARYIKKQVGEKVVVAVTAGASGDINPIYGPGDNFDEIEAVGYHVGKAARETFSKIETYPVETVDAVTDFLVLPGKQECKDHYPHMTFEKGPDVEVGLTVFRIGTMVLAGISGEVMNEIGTNIKQQSPYKSTVVITHCNGSSGYICTDKAFPEGGYEVQVTRLMPGAEKPLTDRIIKMIQEL